MSDTRMSMKLWVDPRKPMPEGYDLHARNQEQAIAYLEQHDVAEVSIGTDCIEVCLHLLEGAVLGTIPPTSLRYHDYTQAESRSIERVMKLAQKYWEKIR